MKFQETLHGISFESVDGEKCCATIHIAVNKSSINPSGVSIAVIAQYNNFYGSDELKFVTVRPEYVREDVMNSIGQFRMIDNALEELRYHMEGFGENK